jgi:hypothetical protein
VKFYSAHDRADDAKVTRGQLNGCAPESVAYAQALSEQGDHHEAVRALKLLLDAAPLNRAARLMLIRELQLFGDDREAQRAAAEWKHIAPSADNYRRLAATSIGGGDLHSTAEDKGQVPNAPFYSPYRRNAMPLVRETADQYPGADTVLLLNDRVAISRADGSVSLYVHTVTRIQTLVGAEEYGNISLAVNVQIIGRHLIKANQTVDDSSFLALSPGDAMEEEYVVNFIGDGGIAQHSEAFQFVFGSFKQPLVHAKFVVLTPASQSDRGIVISTGERPEMTEKSAEGMLARVWEWDSKSRRSDALTDSVSTNLSIIRVMEQDNGWVIPRNAERQRRIETIHPGPRLEES